MDAVPLEVRGLLDAPGIGLVRAVGGEVEGAEGDVADIEVALLHDLVALELVQRVGEAHGALDTLVGEIRRLAVLAEQLGSARDGGILPVVAVGAELVEAAVAVRIARDLLADGEEVVPGPVVLRHGDAFAVEQRAVDEHQARHAFGGQGVERGVICAAAEGERSGVEVVEREGIVLLSERIER